MRKSNTQGGVPAWTEPRIERVASGVHRIPLPLPGDALKAVNVYAIDDGDGVTLIDAGWALDEARLHLERALGNLGYDFRSIRRFLVTHVHRDHYTQAIALRRLFGTHVALGLGEQPSLEDMIEAPRVLSAAWIVRLRRAGATALLGRLLADMKLEETEGIWEKPDEWLRGGTAIRLEGRTLDVIDTPGHTRGHIVFHDTQSRLLFAGDHVLPDITPSIGFEPVPARSPLRDYIESLRLIASLDDSRLLPAHGPIKPSTHIRVRQLLAHHEDRLGATLRAVHAGASTADAVAHVLSWTRRERRMDDFDDFNQMLAVNETIAHLDLLVDRQLLRKVSTSNVQFYEPV